MMLLRFLVEHDAALGDLEDALELVRDDHDREAERRSRASGSARRARPRSPDRGRPTARRGRGVAARAPSRARCAARFFMPPEISDGQLVLGRRRARRARSLARTIASIASAARSVHSRERQRDVLADGHRAEERARLEHHAERRPAHLERRARRRRRSSIVARHRRLEPDQVAEQRRLAAAAAAEDREDLAARHVERQVLAGGTRSPQPIGQVLHGDDRASLIGRRGVKSDGEARVDEDEREEGRDDGRRGRAARRPRRRRGSRAPAGRR